MWGSAGGCWVLWGQAAFRSLLVLSPSTPASPTAALSPFSCTGTMDLFQPHFYISHSPPPSRCSIHTHISPSSIVLIEAYRHFVATSVQSGVDVSRAVEGRGKKGKKLCSTQHFISITLSPVIWREKRVGCVSIWRGGVDGGGGVEWETQRAVIEMCVKL